MYGVIRECCNFLSKNIFFDFRHFLSLFLCALGGALLISCSSPKAGLDAPELPARHWLEETPGVPIEKKSSLQSAVPNLYDPQKLFTFEDCVYLAIQQSPVLVNSAVEIEIKKLDLTSAAWDYLPEPKMNVRVSSNLTSFNKNLSGVPHNYGQTNVEVGFSATFPNPITTYFNHQAKKALLNLAITTHRKAMGQTISDIADIYKRLDAQRRIIDLQKELIPLNGKIATYWKKLESVEGRQGVSLNLAIQKQREAELKLERSQIENTMLRTKLKIISGVDIMQKLNIDTKHADKIFADFNSNTLKWEDRWTATEDALLLRSQVRLRDFNILVAWAEYIPDMNFSVNKYPPSGQYQPTNGTEDLFAHLSFDFPLIDWGRRYRGVQSARMAKAQAFQDQIHARTQYSNSWTEAKQQMHLSETSLKIAQTTLEVAKMQETEANINFKEGLVKFPELASKQEAHINARIAYIQAELDYKLAQLRLMNLAETLKERFIGLPLKEVL